MCCLNEQQYNMYIVKMFEIVFTFNVKDINILDFPITFRNASVLCQSECICLHKTVNMAVFVLLKVMKIPTQKDEHSCKCTELSL